MQNLPRNTKSEVVSNLLAIEPIEVEIDRRKLIFVEQLCKRSHLRVKELFILRMMNYFDNPRRRVGFISDINRILEKYSLFCKNL